MKRKPSTISQADWDEVDSPELTAEEIARMRPASEVLPGLVGAEAAADMLKPRGRPMAVHRKVLLSVRYSPEVVDYFRALGDGWQTRMDEALKEWIASHR